MLGFQITSYKGSAPSAPRAPSCAFCPIQHHRTTKLTAKSVETCSQNVHRELPRCFDEREAGLNRWEAEQVSFQVGHLLSRVRIKQATFVWCNFVSGLRIQSSLHLRAKLRPRPSQSLSPSSEKNTLEHRNFFL
jgi:hypothetical protein